MNTIDRIGYGCGGAIVFLFGGLFMLIFWPVGIFLGFYGGLMFLEAFSKTYPEIISRRRGPNATLEFGPTGPPVPDGTPPIQLQGKMIFSPAIRAILFYPSSPPDLEVWPNGIQKPIPGTARGHHSAMRLEGGEEVELYETEDNSLRYWVLHYVESARPMAAGISLVDSE
jgi:hypothetical protein